MSFLQVAGLRKAYAGQAVLRGADLVVPAGAVVALLGASGCGKTTLLRLLAGFDIADAGRIVMGERVLAAPGTHVPAEQRHIGYVPQEGTLFPHLTVAGNVGFGLRRSERHGGRVEEALSLTGLTGLEQRYPHQLSGGQQQRTALARALAPRPELILLDEPFNALDLALRRRVCDDVVALLRATGTTAILVTHDPQEAFASADLVAVMRSGVIAQCADPTSLYRHPVDPEVARLTGEAIFLDGTIRDGRADTVLGPLELHGGTPTTGAVHVMVRPEQITLAAPGAGVPARRLASVFRGDHTLVKVIVGDTRLDLRLPDIDDPVERLHLQVRGACSAFTSMTDHPAGIAW